ncbi:hypothetical protein NO2_0423 [Candidatus Termititenax persephonae]|uniref:Uncharacterized protein n=1 Tax=Candidatus Termititenax persephonae TaxID=2218525 RepID=A0A388TG74_9BACT|nr:hypothetical protein NO2_0423 [Candidatus Termititenax persephonae]
MSIWACPKCKVLTNTPVCQKCGSATERVEQQISSADISNYTPVSITYTEPPKPENTQEKPQMLKKYIAESLDEMTPNKVVGYIIALCGVVGFFMRLDSSIAQICILGGLALCGISDKIDADYYGKKEQ